MANANAKNLPLLLLVAGFCCLASGGVLFGECNNLMCVDYVSVCDPLGGGAPSGNCFEETHCENAPCDFQLGASYGVCQIAGPGYDCGTTGLSIGYCTHYGQPKNMWNECDCAQEQICETTDEIPLKEWHCATTTFCP